MRSARPPPRATRADDRDRGRGAHAASEGSPRTYKRWARPRPGARATRASRSAALSTRAGSSPDPLRAGSARGPRRRGRAPSAAAREIGGRAGRRSARTCRRALSAASRAARSSRSRASERDAQALELGELQAGVRPLLAARRLPVARRGDARGDDRRRLGPVAAERLGVGRVDAHDEVEPVDQRPAEAGAVALDALRSCTCTRPALRTDRGSRPRRAAPGPGSARVPRRARPPARRPRAAGAGPPAPRVRTRSSSSRKRTPRSRARSRRDAATARRPRAPAPRRRGAARGRAGAGSRPTPAAGHPRPSARA